MLHLLRQNTSTKHIVLTEEFHQDLRWFNRFLPVFNGVSFFNYTPSKVIHLDACPTGLGAIYDQQVYALPLSRVWQAQNIAYLEMINILVALKVWHAQWAGTRVLIKCDNQAVVAVLNNGKTRDLTLARYARNIFLWLSACNIDMKVVHVAGKLNPVADLLSRWHITNNNFQKLQEMVHPVTWISISEEYLLVDETI